MNKHMRMSASITIYKGCKHTCIPAYGDVSRYMRIYICIYIYIYIYRCGDVRIHAYMHKGWGHTRIYTLDVGTHACMHIGLLACMYVNGKHTCIYRTGYIDINACTLFTPCVHLFTPCLHVVYTLLTPCLHLAYTCLHLVYTLVTL